MTVGTAILALLLAQTPEEQAYCKQYIAWERNQCEIAADELPAKEQQKKLRACAVRYSVGQKACAKDDGDLYRNVENDGKDN